MAGNRSGRHGPGRVAVHQQVASGLAELVPDLDRPDSWILFVDGTPQSQVDLADPLYLEFEYVRRLAHILDLAAPAGEPLDVLHLGGGGLTLASLALLLLLGRSFSRKRPVAGGGSGD